MPLKVRTEIDELVPAFFERVGDVGNVRCVKCSEVVPLKGSKTNSRMTSHLHRKDHSLVLLRYEEALKAKAAPATTSAAPGPSGQIQLSLQQSLSKGKPFAAGSAEERHFHHLVLRFVVEAGLPMALVEREGLQRLLSYVSGGKAVLRSREFYRQQLEPLYQKVVSLVRELIAESEPFVSLTTDGWGDTSSKAQLQSLTGHLLHRGRRLKLCLSAVPLEERHTADYLKEKIRECLDFWALGPAVVSAIAHDNEKAVSKAVRELLDEDFPHTLDVRCAQHTMQLLVGDGLKAQKKVSDLMAKVRQLSGHFSHSIESARQLVEIQEREERRVLAFTRCNETRWDSEYKTLQRMLEIEDSLRELAARRHSRLPVSLTDEEWALAKELVEYLALFREFSLEMQSDSACLGPLLNFLRKVESAASSVGNVRGLAAMKVVHHSTLYSDKAEKPRFGFAQKNPIFALAEALDPRLKDRRLSAEQKEGLAQSLTTYYAYAKEAEKSRRPEVMEAEGGASPAKQPRDGLPVSQLWRSDSSESLAEEAEGSLTDEFRRYLASPRLGPETDPLLFWFHSELKELRLAGLYVQGINPSQCSSEQLFSCVGNIVTPKRSRLLPGVPRLVVGLCRLGRPQMKPDRRIGSQKMRINQAEVYEKFGEASTTSGGAAAQRVSNSKVYLDSLWGFAVWVGGK